MASRVQKRPQLTDAQQREFSLEDVVTITAEWYSGLTAVLARMEETEVRDDFLKMRVLKSQDLQGMLFQLDGLRELLMPPWSPEPKVREAQNRAAGMHVSNILCEKEQIFDIPTDYGDLLKFTYKAWFEALNKLLNCDYWNTQVTENSSIPAPGGIFDYLDAESEEEQATTQYPKDSSRRKAGLKQHQRTAKQPPVR